MSYQCPLCSIDPSCHSLEQIDEIQNIVYFYTCPSKAKLYYDSRSIIEHYNGVLSEIETNKEWIWVFDSLDFNFSHFIQFSVAIDLAKLISSKFSHNLNKIIIINPTFYISSTYNIIYPFLNNKLKQIIEFNKIYKSKEEFITPLDI
jgi:hypothetical protein